MKNWKRLIAIAVVLIIVGVCIYNKINSQIKYNTSYVNGNTGGNLYNAGLFCESNGTIFFANPDDCNYLYSMTPTGGDIKKICEDSVMYINADDNYVYYVRNNNPANNDYSFFSYNNNSLCRISRNGGKTTILDEAPCLYASLIGNYIYYLHYDTETATTLYKIKIDGTEKKQLSKKYLFTCNAIEKYFYYNSPENGMLYQYNTETDSSNLMLECNCYKPIVANDSNVYYLDVNHNNSLVHNDMESNNPITLSKDFIEIYNVYGSYIFYQRGGDNPALCMIKNDGTDYKEIAAGEYKNINITSFYMYFTDFYTNEVYYTSTNNPDAILNFRPGKG